MKSAVGLFLVLLFLPVVRAGELKVAAAVSLSEAVTEIGSAYARETGTKISPAFGGSNVLARQIEAGAPLDVFISADERTMDALKGKSLVVSPEPLLTNALVVVVAADSKLTLGTAEDLLKVSRIATGDPAAVPAGVYARGWLEKEGLWEKLSAKCIGTENVRGALAAVESGNVDASIVYRTDAQVSNKVKIAFTVEGKNAPAILYPAAVCAASKQTAEAKKFLAFLRGKEATEIFSRRGFGLAPVKPE